jgi:thiamine biosynthesis lipoprotein
MRYLLILGAALLLAACQPAPKLYSQESYVFGTRVEVLVWDAPPGKAPAAVAEVLREFDRLHRTYHAWQPSEMTALNEAIAAGKSHEVSPEFAQYVRDAQALSAKGDHLFDPGIGALVKLWGFHDDSFKAQLPDPVALAKLVKAKPSIADLTISGNVISSRNPAVALDFGGYLKGVALDHAIDILWRYDISNALVNIGGNVMALGSKDGKPWRVGIQSPRSPAPLATLDLRDGEAIGTSGDYQRFFELDGKRYCHLIDPRTGAPACSGGEAGAGWGTQAVTVLITPRRDAGMWSDWASKPIFIVGAAGWRAMADKLGVTHVLRVDGNGKIEMTDAMRERVKLEAKP